MKICQITMCLFLNKLFFFISFACYSSQILHSFSFIAHFTKGAIFSRSLEVSSSNLRSKLREKGYGWINGGSAAVVKFPGSSRKIDVHIRSGCFQEFI